MEEEYMRRFRAVGYARDAALESPVLSYSLRLTTRFADARSVSGSCIHTYKRRCVVGLGGDHARKAFPTFLHFDCGYLRLRRYCGGANGFAGLGRSRDGRDFIRLVSSGGESVAEGARRGQRAKRLSR